MSITESIDELECIDGREVEVNYSDLGVGERLNHGRTW